MLRDRRGVESNAQRAQHLFLFFLGMEIVATTHWVMAHGDAKSSHPAARKAAKLAVAQAVADQSCISPDSLISGVRETLSPQLV